MFSNADYQLCTHILAEFVHTILPRVHNCANAHIMLNALTHSKRSKVCQPNMLEPTLQHFENLLRSVMGAAGLAGDSLQNCSWVEDCTHKTSASIPSPGFQTNDRSAAKTRK